MSDTREVVVSIHVESYDYGPYEVEVDTPEASGDEDEARDRFCDLVVEWLDTEAGKSLAAFMEKKEAEWTAR